MIRRPATRSALLAALSALVLLAPSGLSAQATPLRAGQTYRGSLAQGDTVRYSVDIPADHFFYAELDQVSVDVAVRVLDADGRQLGRVNSLGVGSERFARIQDEAVSFTLEVIPADEDEAGDYALTVHRLEPLETDPGDLVDQIMVRWDGDDTPGAAVRVWRDGQTLYSKAFGMANLAYGIPFETDTRTNIGSTSKQFTAFAVMLQQERGALSLDDDIRRHIPELPDFGDTIRVRHLITHTSGLREFLNLLLMEGRRLDHGDWIDRSELIEIVKRQPALQNEPGAEWNYNNTAFGLAALIVERTSGMPFHAFLRENVFEPLGMTRTMVRPSREHIVPESSEGYTPGAGGFMEKGDLGGAVGAGGIYTTVEDLQRWAENFSDPVVGSPEIFEEMMTSFVLNDGEKTNYGYGLSVDEQRGLRRVHHGGADISHRSMLVYYPEIDAGVTVQSNHAEFPSSVAFQIAEAFFEDAMEPEMVADSDAAAEFDPESYDPEDFDEYVGRYALDAAPNFILSFFREGETLYTQATGQQRIEIRPTSDSTFALTVVEASVTFHRNDDGEVDGLTLNQNGERHATRLADDEEEAEEWEPTPEALRAYVGEYFSRELETFYRIALEDDHLVLHHRRLDDAELSPGDMDEFSGGGFNFAFERDRNGRLIGFYVANGRTRDVRFERVR